MKLTKQRFKEIIKEELKKEWINRSDIENVPEPTGPGWEKKYHVVIPHGKLEIDDLDAAVETAKNWLEMGIEPDPKGTSPEVMEKLLSLSSVRQRRLTGLPRKDTGPPPEPTPHYEHGMKYGGIKEWGVGSLANLNLKPQRGEGWHEATPEEQAEIERLHSAGSSDEDILGELREMLQVWEYREYNSDRDRWVEYSEDVEALIKRHEMPLEEENKNEAE